MTHTYTCTECRSPIPNGAAVLRGDTHERRAYHRVCYELRGIETATLVASAPGRVQPGSLSLRKAVASARISA